MPKFDSIYHKMQFCDNTHQYKHFEIKNCQNRSVNKEMRAKISFQFCTPSEIEDMQAGDNITLSFVELSLT